MTTLGVYKEGFPPCSPPRRCSGTWGRRAARAGGGSSTARSRRWPPAPPPRRSPRGLLAMSLEKIACYSLFWRPFYRSNEIINIAYDAFYIVTNKNKSAHLENV